MNYEIHGKEILAVIRRLKNWEYLLKDTKFKLEVWTSYKNLEYFMNFTSLFIFSIFVSSICFKV